MEKTKSDHALALVKAGISAVPIVGGPVASLISDYVPSATDRSRDQMVELLRVRLEELGQRLSVDAVNKDEFSELFKACYLIVVQTHQETKLRGAANLVAHVLLDEGDPAHLSYEELDHFVRCLGGLSIGSIEVLSHLVAMLAHVREDILSNGYATQDLRNLRTRIGPKDLNLVLGLLGELNSYNLVNIPKALSVLDAQQGDYPIELTSLGLRFAEYVLQGRDEPHDSPIPSD